MLQIFVFEPDRFAGVHELFGTLAVSLLALIVVQLDRAKVIAYVI